MWTQNASLKDVSLGKTCSLVAFSCSFPKNLIAATCRVRSLCSGCLRHRAGMALAKKTRNHMSCPEEQVRVPLTEAAGYTPQARNFQALISLLHCHLHGRGYLHGCRCGEIVGVWICVVPIPSVKHVVSVSRIWCAEINTECQHERHGPDAARASHGLTPPGGHVFKICQTRCDRKQMRVTEWRMMQNVGCRNNQTSER